MKKRKNLEEFAGRYQDKISIEVCSDDPYGYFIRNKDYEVIYRLWKPERKGGYSSGWKWSITDYKDQCRVYEDIGNIISAINKILSLKTFQDL